MKRKSDILLVTDYRNIFFFFTFSFHFHKALGKSLLSVVKDIPILVFTLSFIDLIHVIECKELHKRILDTSILWLGLSGQLYVSCPIVGTSRQGCYCYCLSLVSCFVIVVVINAFKNFFLLSEQGGRWIFIKQQNVFFCSPPQH